MKYLRWLLRAWPFLLLVLVAIAHFFVYRAYPNHPLMVNKVVSAASQIVGGILVLHSINSNLGVFKKQSLTKMVMTWFEEFPLFTESVTAYATGVGGLAIAGHATGHAGTPAPKTIDERIEQIERQIVEIRGEIQASAIAVNQRISEVKDELQNQISATGRALNDLTTQVHLATVDGFKEQAFGILLVVYGSFWSIYS